MFIHQYLKKGTSHENFCEDYTFVHNIDNRLYIAGVFDGCSGGKESYFASAIYGKAFKNFTGKLNLSDFSNTEEILKHLVYKTITNIKCFADKFYFSQEELLSTIIILVADMTEKKGNILCIGDGFLSINGENHNIDQNNTPDYLTYHFNKITNIEEFEKWYDFQHNKFEFNKVEDITISTDGINSFITEIKNEETKNQADIIDFLTNDKSLVNNTAMLGRKINILKNKYGQVNYDDLGIVRIIVP
jgi:serine/threonine protein phosphatase PrpC